MIKPAKNILLLIFLGITVFFFISIVLSPTDSALTVDFDSSAPTEVFNLLVSLWLISFLIESFIERIIIILKIDNRTDFFALVIGFLLSMLVCISGVRTIDVFFSVDQAGPLQKHLFHTMDIFLSAGLITGGSEGIHQLTKAFREIIGAAQKQAKSSATQAEAISAKAEIDKAKANAQKAKIEAEISTMSEREE